MSKFTILMNGKEKDLTTEEVSSKAGLIQAVNELYNETKVESKTETVADILNEVEAKCQAIKQVAEQRAKTQEEENKKAELARDLADKFQKLFLEFRELMKNHSENEISNNEKLNVEKKYLEQQLAYTWKSIKKTGYHTQILKAFPKLKPFCKVLEMMIKQGLVCSI